MSHVTDDSTTSPTLEQERQSLVRTRILRAGREALRDIGANVTVEEIADRAGTSRRTVFRYYPTREDLIAATLISSFDAYAEQLEGIDEALGLEDWLLTLATKVHDLNARLGAGYWQLLVTPQPAGPIADALERRRGLRATLSTELATRAWRLAGRRKQPPDRVISSFTLLLGPLTTAALSNDAGLDHVDAAKLTVWLLSSAIRAN